MILWGRLPGAGSVFSTKLSRPGEVDKAVGLFSLVSCCWAYADIHCSVGGPLVLRYVVFLQLFLETAEQYFMVGHRVIYYVFTDRPVDVPAVAGR